ncbi:MAG TPA: DUF1501 domain-containing protein [Gemmataceae bacterium]|jgi:hypothetical protein|nr:DUF1501 domain-containing protein [Gemmataceae bacterium]
MAARLETAGRLPSRRDWLRIGVPALLGCRALGHASSPSASSLPGFGRAKSVLVVFTSGGQSQLDTWDPKPDAPAEIRGAFGTIATSVPGFRVCEHMPRLAKLHNRVTVLRSMTHDDLDHGSACYLALTGQFHPRKSSNPPPKGTDAPALGAILHRVRPDRRFPHSAFHVNGPLLTPSEPGPGQYGGLLGRGYDPLDLGDVTDGTALLTGLSPRPDLPAARFGERSGLVHQLEAATHANEKLPATDGQQALARQAFELLHTPRVRDAFDIAREPTKVRDRYGRFRAGQACLMGRRLIEAGVPWVTVFFNHNIRGQDFYVGETDHYGWDTHNDIFEDMKSHLLPRFDHGFSALLEDLDERGLLKDTLVVCMGEFGRAPLIALERNFVGRGSPGRKHWAKCYSVVLAGAGITPGASFGRSDRQAAYPLADPVMPGDLAATLFHALGIPADTHYEDFTSRPSRIVTGAPVTKLFA